MEDSAIRNLQSAIRNRGRVVKALVTGGGGFLGKAIVKRLLDRGWAVRSLNRGDYPDLVALVVEQIRGDLADPGTVDAAVQGSGRVTIGQTTSFVGRALLPVNTATGRSARPTKCDSEFSIDHDLIGLAARGTA